MEGIKKRIYSIVANKFPGIWKIFRIMLWGKYDFNNLKTWENSYSNIGKKQIAKLNTRVKNLVTETLLLTEDAQNMLEISAGFGNFISKIKNHQTGCATEYSSEAVRYLRNIGIPTEKAILPNLPYKDDSFDVVVALSVFEHLKNRTVIRQSFKECHRICRIAFIISVPYGSMQPWNTLLHNYDFKKEDILTFSKGLFWLNSWNIIQDGNTNRSLSYLKKITRC